MEKTTRTRMNLDSLGRLEPFLRTEINSEAARALIRSALENNGTCTGNTSCTGNGYCV